MEDDFSTAVDFKPPVELCIIQNIFSASLWTSESVREVLNCVFERLGYEVIAEPSLGVLIVL